MTSIREQIMVAIKAALTGISTANGYDNDIHGGVQRFQQEGAQLSNPPAILLSLEDEQKQRLESNICECTMIVSVEVQAIDDEENPDDTATYVDSLVTDVERALAIDSRFGELAIDSEVTGVNPQVLVEGQPYVGSTLTLIVRYRHDISDPRIPR